MDHTTAATLDDTATSASETDTVNDSELLEDELLVEEISIDGMCGVY
jgi:mycofactocin precursor